MIRYPYQDGYLLIPQPAHAWLSGQLAQHWGIDEQSRPQPYSAVVIATTMHDAGWLEKDGLPILNADNQPLHFLEPLIDDVDEMYLHCVNYAMQIDPYAGVLVSRHIQMIFQSRIDYNRDPKERIQPILDTLKQEEQATLTRLQSHPTYQHHLEPTRLNHNYRILRTCDLLSLFVCGAFPARTVPDVPLHYDEDFITLECQLLDDHTLQVSPKLFNQDELRFDIDARYIPQETFDTQDDYVAAFNNAERITMTKTIISR